MSNDLSAAVESLYNELNSVSERAAEIKKSINSLSALMGKPQPFPDVESSSYRGNSNLRPDQFFGKPLAAAVKEYLKMRGQACTAQEIYEALKMGGYEFPKEWTPKYQLRNLSISMSKNRYDFVYVKSSNAYGLWEFYPGKKRERDNKKNAVKADIVEILDENPEEESDENPKK